MEPLSFSEFLLFKNHLSAGLVGGEWTNFNLSVYNQLNKSYVEYLEFGGFPEVVLAETEADKIAYLKDIVNSYIELDIKLLSDFSVSDDLYKLILLLAQRVGSKVDYTKIGSALGINRQKIKVYINLLEYTYLIKLISPYTHSKDREISLQQKMYFADNGLLNVLGNKNSGACLENQVAIQLHRKGKVQYFAKKSGQEIDFIVNENIAFDVKESPSPSDLNTLSNRAKSISITKYNLIGLKQSNPNFNDFIWAGVLD